MENYEEKYKKALSYVKDLVEHNVVSKENASKYFPELMESDDEKIRKYLLTLVNSIWADAIEEYGDITKEQVIAWLEKQGKQKPIFDVEIPFGANDSELIEDTYFIPKGFHAEIIGNEVHIKQGEQKTVENVNGAAYGIDGLWHAITILEETLGKVEGYQSDDGILEHKCAITAVRDLAKKQREQKHVEWSEEDENTRNKIIGSLDALKFYVERNNKFDTERVESNLKELDGEIEWMQNIVPQPKQEWSEEDEKMLEDCIGAVAAADYYPYEDKQQMEKWLESLKNKVVLQENPHI